MSIKNLAILAMLLWHPLTAAAYTNPYIAGSNYGTAASESAFCSSATTTANGTVGNICEDLRGTGDCLYYVEPDGETCRRQWIDTGGPDSSGNKFTISNTGAVEYVRIDIGDPVAALSVFSKIKILALPAASNKYLIRLQNGWSDYAIARLSSDGTLSLLSSTSASIVNKLSLNGTYYIWMRYVSGGTTELCWSETLTKGTGDNCATVTGEVGTVDWVTYTNTWTSTMNHSFELNNILIDTDAIGDNP